MDQYFYLVRLLSRVQLFATPWTAARQSSLSSTISRSLLKFMFTESMMPSNHLILCRPPPPFTFNLPSIRVFPSELALRIRWPKYQSLSFLLGFQAYYKVITSLLSLPSRCVPNL